MEKRIPVHMDGRKVYDIVMEQSFSQLEEELRGMNLEGRKICVVTDSNVAPLYLEEVERIASACCRKTAHFIFPAGEENKNLIR